MAPHAESPSSLLSAKLRAPAISPTALPRPGVVACLEQAVQSRVTLICAAAGSGKSTALAEWVANTTLDVAFLTLDATDDDPTRFVAYVLAAVREVDESVGSAAETLLHAANPERPELQLADHLVIPLDARTAPLALVLDDLHLLVEPSVHRCLGWLIEHAPPCLRLILASRVAPPLPLAKLTASGALAQVTGNDLRFQRDEVAALLGALDCALTAQQQARLERLTEGWAVTLRLSIAELARGDVEGQLGRIAENPAVTGYLLEEVFARQSPATQRFMLSTSMLGRFDAALAAAVSDDDRPDQLDFALANDLLLQWSDGGRQWYRYHTLFGEFLQRRLEREPPRRIEALHLRAARHLAERGLQDEAVHHAIAARDPELLLSLIARWGRARVLHQDARPVLHWIEALPQQLREDVPWVLLMQAAALLTLGRITDCRRIAARAVEAFDRASGRQVAHRDTVLGQSATEDVARRELRETLDSMECLALFRTGKADDALEAALRLIELDPPPGPSTQASSLSVAGAVLGEKGQLARALPYLERAYQIGRSQGHPYLAFAAAAAAARALRGGGDLAAARRWCDIALADENAEPTRLEAGVGRVEIELAAISLAEGDARLALDLGERALARTQAAGDLANAALALEVCARARTELGDREGALSLLDDFDSLLRRTELRPPLDAAALRRELSEQDVAHEPEPSAADPPERARPPLQELTERELEILAHAGAGMSNVQISRTLHISVATVKTHMHRVMHKLAAQNRTGATHRARRLGLIN